MVLPPHMELIDCSMSDKDPNKIAAIEQAIAKKYGADAIQNPRANWDEIKEKDYLEQMRELYEKTNKNSEWQEKVDVNGIKITKKLLNRESLKYCPGDGPSQPQPSSAAFPTEPPEPSGPIQCKHSSNTFPADSVGVKKYSPAQSTSHPYISQSKL